MLLLCIISKEEKKIENKIIMLLSLKSESRNFDKNMTSLNRDENFHVIHNKIQVPCEGFLSSTSGVFVGVRKISIA